MSLTELSLNIPTDHVANVFGQFDGCGADSRSVWPEADAVCAQGAQREMPGRRDPTPDGASGRFCGALGGKPEADSGVGLAADDAEL